MNKVLSSGRYLITAVVLLAGLLQGHAYAEAPGPTGDKHVGSDSESNLPLWTFGTSTTSFYLPWHKNHSWHTSNGNCGDGHSCDGGANAYAWDFYPNSGYSGEVVAVADGTVCYVQEAVSDETIFGGPHAGNVVVIAHEGTCTERTNGEYSFYAHLKYNSVPVSVGQVIKVGSVVGFYGNSGYSDGAHLHFSINVQYWTYTGFGWQTASGISKPASFSDSDVQRDGGVPKKGEDYISDNPPSSTCCGCLPAACCGAAAVACDTKGDSAASAISFRNLWPSAPDNAPRAPLPSPIPGPADTSLPAQATPTPTEEPPPTAAVSMQDKTLAADGGAGSASQLADTSPPTFEVVTAELPWTDDPQPPAITWAAAADDRKLAGYRIYWGDDAQGSGSVAVEQARYEPGVKTNNDTAMVRYLRAAAEDAAGNLSAWKTVAIWRYDPIPPGLSLSIGNGDPVVPTLNVTLNLVADDRGSGISKARFSQAGSNWTQWEPYAPYRAWQLEDKPDSQTVYAQVKDAAGNLSGAAQASVTAVLNVELPSSTSYRIARSVLGIGGGAKTSASYRVQGTSGQLSGTSVLAGSSYRVRSGFWAGVTCPLAELAAAPDISIDGAIVTLEWDAVAGASSYRIYRGVEPYFVPGTPYDTTSNTTWTDSDGGGAPSVNHTYVVKAVNGCGESSTLYRVGEFKFALTPGN